MARRDLPPAEPWRWIVLFAAVIAIMGAFAVAFDSDAEAKFAAADGTTKTGECGSVVEGGTTLSTDQESALERSPVDLAAAEHACDDKVGNRPRAALGAVLGGLLLGLIALVPRRRFFEPAMHRVTAGAAWTPLHPPA